MKSLVCICVCLVCRGWVGCQRGVRPVLSLGWCQILVVEPPFIFFWVRKIHRFPRSQCRFNSSFNVRGTRKQFRYYSSALLKTEEEFEKRRRSLFHWSTGFKLHWNHEYFVGLGWFLVLLYDAVVHLWHEVQGWDHFPFFSFPIFIFRLKYLLHLSVRCSVDFYMWRVYVVCSTRVRGTRFDFILRKFYQYIFTFIGTSLSEKVSRKVVGRGTNWVLWHKEGGR